MTDLATTWHDAMRTAATLDPNAIAAQINASADSGLRATRYDSTGGKTTFVACDEPERCDDGPGDHSHMVTSDPTGNAAVNSRGSDPSNADMRQLNRAHIDFVTAAAVVLEYVAGVNPTTWKGTLKANAEIMPGSIQAGIDVDYERLLPRHITQVSEAVVTISRLARFYTSRTPSQDDIYWTSNLSDNDVCAWHLEIHRRYRRPRLPGKNICQDCCALSILLGQKPPKWLREAEVDREGKPREWQRALGRCMDELGVARESA